MAMSSKTLEFLRERLSDAGILHAAVVDDAFDAPTLATLDREDIVRFWNHVERDEGLQAELGVLGVSAQVEDDIDDDAIATLWSRRGEVSPIADHAKATIFEDTLQAQQEVHRLTISLRSLGLKVTEIGTDDPYPKPGPELVFLDYFLGDVRDPDSSERSNRRAQEIYSAASPADSKPFIILMSSRPAVSAEADAFRSKSHLLGGLFDFAAKSELDDPTRLALRLARWTSNMPLRHSIQHFVDSLETTLGERTNHFMDRVKSLSFEDYAFLQFLRLRRDGQPLGDYVQWLFSSLLVNKVLEENNEFKAARGELDRMSFRPQAMNHLFPSTHLAYIYSIAIAERDLDEIGHHPRTDLGVVAGGTSAQIGERHNSGADGEDSIMPVHPALLRLGDLLIGREDERVFMVASPDCDLQFAPETNRVPDGSEAVLLIPGQLEPLGRQSKGGLGDTALFLHGGMRYRIVWHRKKIKTVPIGGFLEWCSREGLTRSARIRLPYALKLQQEVFSAFSRVGMPVPPPLQELVSVDVMYVDMDGNWCSLGQPVESGVSVMHDDGGGLSFFVSPAVVDEMLSAASELIEKYEEWALSANDQRARRLRAKRDKLRRLIDAPEEVIPMLEKKHKMPDRNSVQQVLGDTIALYRTGEAGQKWQTHHILCLRITYD